MKKILTLLSIAFLIVQIQAQQKSPKIEFESTVIDYGTIYLF